MGQVFFQYLADYRQTVADTLLAYDPARLGDGYAAQRLAGTQALKGVLEVNATTINQYYGLIEQNKEEEQQ